MPARDDALHFSNYVLVDAVLVMAARRATELRPRARLPRAAMDAKTLRLSGLIPRECVDAGWGEWHAQTCKDVAGKTKNNASLCSYGFVQLRCRRTCNVCYPWPPPSAVTLASVSSPIRVGRGRHRI